MISWLDKLDQSLFLFFNGLHASWLDGFFWLISGVKIWIPFYALLLFLIIRKDSNGFKSVQWKQIIALVLTIALTITIADQLASGLLKPLIGRLRPSHNPSLEGIVHLLKNSNGDFYRGGKYGFVSSHAANSFALAIFIVKVLASKRWSIVLLTWASFVSYSRIYLGVHYPGDILGGAIVGILAGEIGSRLYLISRTKWSI